MTRESRVTDSLLLLCRSMLGVHELTTSASMFPIRANFYQVRLGSEQQARKRGGEIEGSEAESREAHNLIRQPAASLLSFLGLAPRISYRLGKSDRFHEVAHSMSVGC